MGGGGGDCKSHFQLSVHSMRHWWEAAKRGYSGMAWVKRDGRTQQLQGSRDHGEVKIRARCLFAFLSLHSLYGLSTLCCDAAGNITTAVLGLVWSWVT